MAKQPETGRFCIQVPAESWQSAIWKRTETEYPTREKALTAARRKYHPIPTRVRKLPDHGPLTKNQKSVMAHLNKIGYDSCYNTLMKSKYKTDSKDFMGGTGPMISLEKRGLVAFKVGVVNPHRKSKATCTIVAAPWIIKYYNRFDNWPPQGLIQEMKKNAAYKQSSD